LLKKRSECFDMLMLRQAQQNGKFFIIPTSSPFAPSINSGQALSLVEGVNGDFQATC